MFYRGNRNGRFTEIGRRLRGDLSESGKGVSWADYDNDGDMNMHVVPHDQEGSDAPNPTHLFNNSGGNNHWLQVELKGIASNLDAIGAKITITPLGSKKQIREINGGRGFFAQDSPIQHFGLNRTTAASVTVQWPSGSTDTVRRIAADQRVTIIEGVGLVTHKTQ